MKLVKIMLLLKPDREITTDNQLQAAIRRDGLCNLVILGSSEQTGDNTIIIIITITKLSQTTSRSWRIKAADLSIHCAIYFLDAISISIVGRVGPSQSGTIFEIYECKRLMRWVLCVLWGLWGF